MNDRVDPLKKFRREGQPSPITADKPVSEKRPYVAYKLSTNERRYLEIRPKYPDPFEAVSYAMLLTINGEWRWGSGFALDYSKPMVVDIKGENLTELMRAIQEWRVEFIAEFDPEEHEPVTDETLPYIKSITIHTTRPEQPPPVKERH